MNTKKWYQSRTVWSGIVKISAGIIMSFASFLSGDIDGQLFTGGLITGMFGMYDIVIRFDTNQQLN